MRRPTLLAGLLLLSLLEFANVWFIMPLPGSQRIRSLEVAYAIHAMRWPVRGVAIGLVVLGLRRAWGAGPWHRAGVVGGTLAVAAAAYVVNFRMAADAVFRMPRQVTMATAAQNRVALDRLVVGVAIDGQARAYPLQFIGYHHQVRDTIAGREVLVTYCTVCRTGRVFDPRVADRVERFRLVGMDRFNAMLEDRTTGSWWRQANGEAVAGPLEGVTLDELPSRQVTLRQWLVLHPSSLVMQADPAFAHEYAKDYAFERGTSRSRLTGTDPRSWEEKSWVVGVRVRGAPRAYDWNRLLRERVVNDTLGGRPIVLVVAADSASFFAFVRPDDATRFTLAGDSLRAGKRAFAFSGTGPDGRLEGLVASQEFWHSWRTFHPSTTRY